MLDCSGSLGISHIIISFVILCNLNSILSFKISCSTARCNQRKTISMEYTIADASNLPVKQVLNAVCGSVSAIDSKYLFEGVDIEKAVPTVCKYIVANPKAFLEKPKLAKQYGFDLDALGFDSSTPLSLLAPHLPVIYIADIHNEFGTLGYQLNKKAGIVLNELYPELRSLRSAEVYLGGYSKKGSSFTMLHSKMGFPDNRSLKSIPGSPKLFFSPNVAMANELVSTKDAKMNDFKFFQWATVILPNQLQIEYASKLWLCVKAPTDLLFSDDRPERCPLWTRIIASLPSDRLAISSSSSSSSSGDGSSMNTNEQ